MNKDPIRGKTIRWTFSDGPMAKKTFEHSFDKGGTVTFRMFDDNGQAGKPSDGKKYESVHVGQNVHAISYLGTAGYTLTVILDFDTGKLVAFASNEKELTVQHGTFEADGVRATSPKREQGGKSSHAH
jgi:MoaF N-terminal domain